VSAESQAQSGSGPKEAMRGYLATVDSPGCDLYAELMAIYPNAKVVLSVRDSDDQWWKSFCSTIGVQLGWRYPLLIYPIGFMRKQQRLVDAIVERWRSLPGMNGTLGPRIHAAHIKMVKETVPKERLLEFNVKIE